MSDLPVYYIIIDFLNRGGTVLYIIVIASILLWFLVFERLIYIYFRASRDGNELSKTWLQYTHNKDALHIRSSLQYDFKQRILLTLPLIKILVRITPMLGLFGTVYGMIETFDVIAHQGTGDARAMANGISMATLPTMTGMAVAIIGLFFQRHIEVTARHKINCFNEGLQAS